LYYRNIVLVTSIGFDKPNRLIHRPAGIGWYAHVQHPGQIKKAAQFLRQPVRAIVQLPSAILATIASVSVASWAFDQVQPDFVGTASRRTAILTKLAARNQRA
jgi:hypothetical protein